MQIEVFRFNAFEVNTYIVSSDGECAIIDPGCYTDQEKQVLVNFIKQKYTPKYIIDTHLHCDHILGVNYLKNEFSRPFAATKQDEFLLAQAQDFGRRWGWNIVETPKIDTYLNDGDTFKIGSGELKIMLTPGHTPGQVAIYSLKDKFVIVGDTLFKGSVGRTDLEGGNLDSLMDSIKDKIITLGGDFTVFPGHGPITTINAEIRENPFLSFFGEDLVMDNL